MEQGVTDGQSLSAECRDLKREEEDMNRKTH